MTAANEASRLIRLAFALCVALLLVACGETEQYDLIIRNGTVYDGLGSPAEAADVGINGDRIVAIGDLSAARAGQEIDATGLSVAPGFINMLSWATRSLIEDGRGMSDIKQGVTLEIMGEGSSMGPHPGRGPRAFAALDRCHRRTSRRSTRYRNPAARR